MNGSPARVGAFATIGLAVLAVTCCVGAPILAAGGLAIAGAAVLHAWPVAVAIFVVIAIFVTGRLLLLQSSVRKEKLHP